MGVSLSGKVSSTTAFLTAVQFLTRVPVVIKFSEPEQDYRVALKASLIFFPLVGTLIGLATAGMYVGACYAWPVWVAAILALAMEAWLTGAFHEDAFADATDALGGGWTREQVLEILKDSRHGTYGVLALVLGVSLRIALVSQCDWVAAWLVIPFSAGMGRWSILLLMHRLDPILDRHTLVRDIGTKPSGKQIAIGLLPLGILGLLWIYFGTMSGSSPTFGQPISMGVSMLVAVGVSLLVTWYYGNLIQRRVGGVTGDFLGSNCYLVQLATLLVMTASIH